MQNQIIAGAIFLVTFIGILMERVDRAIVAMAGGGAMVAMGLALGFYGQEEALASVDFNTLGLLLGMMILVALLAQTGFFQYLATLTAQKSRGNPWRLLLILGSITTLLSMVLDNVTTIVLIAPISILIAEVLGISPIPFLISGALLSNTGGVATLVGDPPNILIGSAANLSFNDFLVRLAPIVAVAWVGAVLLLRFLFRTEMGQEPRDADALDHIDPTEALTDKNSLSKVLIVMGLVILGFFFHTALHLEPAFVALLGAAIAMLWVQPEIEEILKDVEWSVLLFFAALFVLVGGLEASGLLNLLAGGITELTEADVMLTGIGLIWFSAIMVNIVNNIPYTIVMIPVVHNLGNLGVDITPLWWALALGAGFGANGTPIGSTANIISIKVSERTRRPITTALWLRTGLPVAILACLIGTILYALTFPLM